MNQLSPCGEFMLVLLVILNRDVGFSVCHNGCEESTTEEDTFNHGSNIMWFRERKVKCDYCYGMINC